MSTLHDNFLFNKHISFTSCKDVKDICHPLFTHTPIKVFGYSRVFSDGSRSELGSHAGHLENAFITRAKMRRVYTPTLIPADTRILLVTEWIKNLSSPSQVSLESQLYSQHELFGIGNELSIVNSCADYVEYYHFYAASHSPGIENFYFNNIDLLEKFTQYFSNKAVHLIQLAVRDKLIKPWLSKDNESVINSPDHVCEIDKQAFLRDITMKRIFVNNTDYLTKREIDCAILLVQGKTNREIASQLYVSPRTVETHMESIRNKTNIKNRRELIGFLQNVV